MTNYTLKNLKEIDDSAVQFGLSPQMEAHFARKPLEAEQSGVSYQRLSPDFRQPFGHRHGDQEETYVILAGAGRIKLDDQLIDLQPFDAIKVPPQVARCLEAGPDGLEFLAFGAGEANEVEMLEDFWPVE